MGVFRNLTKSIKSFSKNCFDEIKNRSPKYTKVLARFNIDISKASSVAGAVRNYFGKEIEECLQDKEGYFLKLNSMARETAENTYAYTRYGTSMEQHQQENSQQKETDKKAESNDYDIGE